MCVFSAHLKPSVHLYYRCVIYATFFGHILPAIDIPTTKTPKRFAHEHTVCLMYVSVSRVSCARMSRGNVETRSAKWALSILSTLSVSSLPMFKDAKSYNIFPFHFFISHRWWNPFHLMFNDNLLFENPIVVFSSEVHPIIFQLWTIHSFTWRILRNSASSFHWLSSSIFTVCSFVRCLSRIGNTSSHLHYMMFQTIQTIYFLWGYDPGKMSVSFIAELSPVYCCLVQYSLQMYQMNRCCALLMWISLFGHQIQPLFLPAASFSPLPAISAGIFEGRGLCSSAAMCTLE